MNKLRKRIKTGFKNSVKKGGRERDDKQR